MQVTRLPTLLVRNVMPVKVGESKIYEGAG
jgi:hypothetical protein